MQLTISRDNLLKPLSYVTGVIEKRQTLPILSNILIKGNKNNLQMTGTDLEVEVVVNVDCQGDEGELTLPGRKLMDMCRALPAGAEIKIETQGEKAIVRSGRSRFTLMSLPAGDFPNLETHDWDLEIEIKQSAFKKLLERTHFCMAQQDVRYYLNGLLLEIEGARVRAVATDGHRMALSEIKLDQAAAKGLQVIVPRKGVQEINRFLDDSEESIKLAISANHIRIQAGGLIFTSKLIDGRFPDYNKVIPANQTKVVTLERDLFRDALQRTAILSNEKYRGIRFHVKPEALVVSAHNPEQEEAQEEIPVSYQGEELEIGFNSNYIVEAINSIDNQTVEFRLSDSSSSGTLQAPGDLETKYVVMPMRL